MVEASGIFDCPEVDPGKPEAFDFLKHSLFGYGEIRDGDTLKIEGQVGLQGTVAEVGQQIFDRLESNDNVTFLDRGEGRLSILFDEPLPSGIRVIEVNIYKSDDNKKDKDSVPGEQSDHKMVA